jgi:hypothetical protein
LGIKSGAKWSEVGLFYVWFRYFEMKNISSVTATLRNGMAKLRFNAV